jgi:hypothetical protein
MENLESRYRLKKVNTLYYPEELSELVYQQTKDDTIES